MSAIDYIPGSFKTTMLPQWWGAVGDGVADDTAAIQSAIDHTPNGGDVYLPPGNYKITAPLTLSTNVKVRGSGEYTSAITQADAGENIFSLYGQGGDTRFVVERLWLNGGLNGLSLESGYLDRVSSFRDLRFTAQAHAGIQVLGAMIGCQHSNLSMENTGLYGIYTAATDALGATCWSHVRVAGADTAGVYIEQPSDGSLQPAITFINPVIEYNEGVGLVADSSQLVLINAHFEGNCASNPNASKYDTGGPDICIDSNYPDAIGTAWGSVTMIGGVFSSAGNGQYDSGTACRVWGNNYGTRFTSMRTFYRNDDRIDCKDHADKLLSNLIEHEGTVTVLGSHARLGYYGTKFPGFEQTYVAAVQSLGFFGATPVVQQTATDLATVITALQNLGLIATP